jgi:hypothetical protein
VGHGHRIDVAVHRDDVETASGIAPVGQSTYLIILGALALRIAVGRLQRALLWWSAAGRCVTAEA